MVTFGLGSDDDSQTADPGGGTDPSPTTGRGSADSDDVDGTADDSSTSSRPTRRQRDLLRGRGSTIDRTESVSGATTVTGLDQRQRDLTRGSGPTIDVPVSERNIERATVPDRDIDDQTAQAAADQIDGVTASMIQDVSQADEDGRADVQFTETGQRFRAAQQLDVDPGLIESVDDGRAQFVDAERERRAREQFAQQRPDSDFDSSELDFEATDDGVDVSVRESAIEERREEELEADADFISGLDVDETEEPGTTARAVDVFTDGFARVNPGTAAGIAAVGASLRTDSGLPVPGTGRTLPGQDDVSGFRERLEGPRESIDAGIETAVETAAIGGSRGVGADDLPSIDIDTAADIGMRDPGIGAVATVAGTEIGRDAATEGVTTGLQTFNPAGVAADTALFADAGVRGIDRTIQADVDEVQTGFDTAEAVGEFAVDEGPTIAAGGVARDPGVLISAPVAGATIGAAGVLAPTAAVRGGRSGGRVASNVLDDLDARGARSFADDDRGQLDPVGAFRRQDTDDEPVTIGGEDIEPTRGDPVRRADDGPDIDAADPFQRRRERARRGEVTEDTSRDLAFRRSMGSGERLPGDPPDTDFTGLTSATRRVDDPDAFGVPRDPLDTRGGLLPGAIERTEVAGIGVGTGAATTGLLAELESADMMTALDQDTPTAPTFSDSIASGLSEDVAASTGIGVESGTGGRGGARPAPMELLGGQTMVGVQQGQQITTSQTLGEFSAATERTAGRTARQTGRVPRPPRVPGLPEDSLDEFEDLDVEFGFDDAVFETPTRTLDEADELVVDIGDMEADP